MTTTVCRHARNTLPGESPGQRVLCRSIKHSLTCSSRSDQNIGRRVVFIWHSRWQYLSRHSHQHPVCPDPPSVCQSCHVLFGLPTLLLPPSGLHIMARLAGLVVGSRRMCPTNRLRRVATVSCSAACPVRAITSSFVMWSRHEMPSNSYSFRGRVHV